MTLRIFTGQDGEPWRVWDVHPSGDVRMVRPTLMDGWLCFERLDGGARLRLPRCDVPDRWEELPDERLDLLRQIAAGNVTGR